VRYVARKPEKSPFTPPGRLKAVDSGPLRENLAAAAIWHNQSGDAAAVSCTICERRKEKRFCPAVHGRICPQCCGEQREVTLDCPSDCIYLQQARAHEKPRDVAELEQDALFPQVEISEQFLYERQHLLAGLSYALAKSVRADLTLRDSDLIAALTAISKRYETLVNSGLHYDQSVANPVQQAIISELQKMLLEYQQTELKHAGYIRLRDSEVLRVLVFLLRMALGRTSGRPRARAFIDFLFTEFPESNPLSAGSPEGSSIIVP